MRNTEHAQNQKLKTNIIAVGLDSVLGMRLRQSLQNTGLTLFFEAAADRLFERMQEHHFDLVIVGDESFENADLDHFHLQELVRLQSPSTRTLYLKGRSPSSVNLPSGMHVCPVPETALGLRRAVQETLKDKSAEISDMALRALVGKSPQMRQVHRQIRQAAASDIPVLLQGETGTGKELAARAIHQQSARNDHPYVPVNLAALPGELVASELFGHERGAFTGAHERRKGMFEYAHGGTIFLDEISNIDEKVQVSLLRLLEHRKFHRLGGRRAIAVDVRLVAASNQDLSKAIEQGTFRDDLFYRLDVFRITIPPLRDRITDVPLLIDNFIRRYNKDLNKQIRGVASECLSLFERYAWPGNVRELKNVIQRAVLVCNDSTVIPEHLPPRFRQGVSPRPTVVFEIGTPLHDVEREMIVRALNAASNNRTRAAEMLGISRRALYNKLQRYEIQ